MADLHDFDRLVDRIYEAATNSDDWPNVLHDVGLLVGAAGGAILTRRNDAWLGWRHSLADDGQADAYLISAAQARSQTLPRLLGANHPGFVSNFDVMTEEEWYADPLMTEWGTPAGMGVAIATAVQVPNGDYVIYHFQRAAGAPRFEKRDYVLLNTLRPHLARSGLMAARWRLERLRALTEALSLVGLPAAVVDGEGRVLAANELIQGMTTHVRWLPKDRLAFTDPAATDLLRRAFAELDRPAEASVRSFPVRGECNADPVVAHLIPTPGQARDLFEGGYGILVITPVGAGEAPDVALIQGLFDLTPAEAEVARALTQGLSIDRIATDRAVSRETIKAQLKALFAKTGTNRQSEIVSLLAGLSKPRTPPE